MGLPRKWKTKSGEKVWIKDMETSHIKNCITMLERNVEQHNAEVAAFSGWERSAYYEIDIDDLPIYQALEKQLEKRLDK